MGEAACCENRPGASNLIHSWISQVFPRGSSHIFQKKSPNDNLS